MLNYILATEQPVVTFDSRDKCLVCLITCNKFIKQCTGQTTDHFRSRWNKCKSKSRGFDRGEQSMQEHL